MYLGQAARSYQNLLVGELRPAEELALDLIKAVRTCTPATRTEIGS